MPDPIGVAIHPVDDNKLEPGESVYLMLIGTADYSVMGSNSENLVISDNERPNLRAFHTAPQFGVALDPGAATDADEAIENAGNPDDYIIPVMQRLGPTAPLIGPDAQDLAKVMFDGVPADLNEGTIQIETGSSSRYFDQDGALLTLDYGGTLVGSFRSNLGFLAGMKKGGVTMWRGGVAADTDAELDVRYEDPEGNDRPADPVDTVHSEIVEPPDLDVDSENLYALNPKFPRTDSADKIEDDPNKPGKFIEVNDSDYDGDGIPDFADGFNWDANLAADDMPPTAAQGEHFVPVVLELPEAVDVTSGSNVWLKIEYQGSNPGTGEGDLTRTGDGTASSPFVYTAAPGDMRLWTKDSSIKRDWHSFTNGSGTTPTGDYVPPTNGLDERYDKFDLPRLPWQDGPNGSHVLTLYAEAIRPSAMIGDERIVVKVDFDGPGPGDYSLMDAVRLTAISADVDIDSDNNDGFSAPSRTAAEDQMEAAKKTVAGKDLPGKVVLVNDGDLDGDGVLDYADGFNADGTPNADDSPPTAAQGEHFVPVIITLPTPIDLSKARLQVDYDASVPGGGAGGSLRLWTKDGSDTRSKDPFTTSGGNYVPAKTGNDFYSPADLTALGVSDSSRSKTLYVEAIAPSAAPGDKTITIRIDPDGDGPAGFVAADVIRLTTVRVDLDVNGNKSLNDASDGTVNYLPGYEGTTAKLSTGTTFNTATYAGQQMNLLVQGLGSGTVIDTITFTIGPDVTNLAGYAGNASDAKVEGGTKDDDYSFAADADQLANNGTMEAGRTFVPVWAKDYGGWAKVKVEAKVGTNTFTLREFTIPNDSNGDKIADTWERAKVAEWNAQYGTTEMESPTFFDVAREELKDPDGATNTDGGTNMTDHLTTGDGRTVLDEYRGFILDGGGFDWNGNNPHGGGHARLSPAYKELLVESDAMSGTTNMPTRQGLATWLDAVSIGMSQKADGAGIRMFYVLDNLATPHDTFIVPLGPGHDAAQDAAIRTYLTANINPRLTTFKHLHFVGEFDNRGTAGVTWTDLGSTYAVDTGTTFAASWGIATATYSPAYISHELHHSIIDQVGDDGMGHFNDTNGNGVAGEADDRMRVLWNYHNPGYAADDMKQIAYGLGTTKFISIR